MDIDTLAADLLDAVQMLPSVDNAHRMVLTRIDDRGNGTQNTTDDFGGKRVIAFETTDKQMYLLSIAPF